MQELERLQKIADEELKDFKEVIESTAIRDKSMSLSGNYKLFICSKNRLYSELEFSDEARLIEACDSWKGNNK